MRYQIFSLQQEAALEVGLNLEEVLLLDWMLNWSQGEGMKKKFIEEVQDIGYWVDYGNVITELPILFKQPTSDMDEVALKKLYRNNKDKVGKMLKGNLSKVISTYKVVEKGKNKIGSKVYVVFNRKMVDKLRGNKKAESVPPETTETIKNNLDTNIICETEENNTSNLMENKNVEKNIEDIALDELIAKYGKKVVDSWNPVNLQMRINSQIRLIETK